MNKKFMLTYEINVISDNIFRKVGHFTAKQEKPPQI